MCEMICVLAPHSFPVMAHFLTFALSYVCSCLGPVVCPSLHVSMAGPRIIPRLCPQGPRKPVIAVLWVFHVLSQPCPALRRGRDPSQETGWGLQARESTRDWGPRRVSETRRHPPLSCRLGRSRRVLQVLPPAMRLPKVAPSPEGPGSTIPTPPTPLSAGLAPSAVTLPTGCRSWSGVILMP